ncbi:MAG: hypothetical protein SCM96_08830 [Acidobacteriota bacterium]|nr:hypothetical protein [Acidobacteriota bacterium]
MIAYLGFVMHTTASKITTAAAGLLLFAASAAGQIWFKGDFEDALAQARTEGKKVLIDFYSGG